MIARLIERGYAYVEQLTVTCSMRWRGSPSTDACRASASRTCAPARASRSTRPSAIRWTSCCGKRAKPGEPAWASPWGAGRPGLAHRVLGDGDRAAGRAFRSARRRHGSEVSASRERDRAVVRARAGSRSSTSGCTTASSTLDDEKMSKSLGNFFTVREVLPRLRHPEVLRAFLLSSHYRGPINYSAVQLEQADAALTRLYTALRGLEPIDCAGHGSGAQLEHRARFEAALDDDFNTARGTRGAAGHGARAQWRARARRRERRRCALAAELRTAGGRCWDCCSCRPSSGFEARQRCR